MLQEIIYHLQCFLFSYWTIYWFFMVFYNLRNYELSSYILYGLPSLTLILSFFIDKELMTKFLISLIGVLILAYLGKKIYQAKW